MRSAWLPYGFGAPTAQVRLFCFPHSGAPAAAYRSWARELPAAIGLGPVELPGRGTRYAEQPGAVMSVLIDSLVDGIRTRLDEPFALFGHSLGALLAFEVARALRRARLPEPRCLIASAHRAPSVPFTGRRVDEMTDVEVLQRVRDMGGLPPELAEDSALLASRVKVLRADSMLSQGYGYAPEAPFDFPITAFGGASDPVVPREHVALWEKHTRGEFSMHVFPGGHFHAHPPSSAFLLTLARAVLHPGCGGQRTANSTG